YSLLFNKVKYYIFEFNKKRFFVRLLILFIFFLPTIVYGHGTIIITNVEHDEGYIDLKIYNNKENFLKEDLAIETVRKKAVKGQTIIPLTKIHEGKIAVVVYHDEDSNNELKTGLFWRPKEGFAFSNNYQPKGPPKFSKASINLIHGEPITIELNY
ncbi:DUF2141 domain-containing protein, partial [Alphaproteobacteria bacterium]|nr:DUF2141 domain-containing protein [Alphaproteobacteria bacterium]